MQAQAQGKGKFEFCACACGYAYACIRPVSRKISARVLAFVLTLLVKTRLY